MRHLQVDARGSQQQQKNAQTGYLGYHISYNRLVQSFDFFVRLLFKHDILRVSDPLVYYCYVTGDGLYSDFEQFQIYLHIYVFLINIQLIFIQFYW